MLFKQKAIVPSAAKCGRRQRCTTPSHNILVLRDDDRGSTHLASVGNEPLERLARRALLHNCKIFLSPRLFTSGGICVNITSIATHPSTDHRRTFMKQFLRRSAALGLALAMTVTAASASQALGWDLHTGTAPISVGTTLTKNHFWSDTYSDLRTEYYVSYTPSADVTPTVAYGNKVTDRVTLTGMAQQLEAQGKRVVSGLNGDWYVLSTGAPVGMVVTDGVVRAAGYYNNTYAIGFYEDGTAFIAQNGLSMSVTLGGETIRLSGGINKVRKQLASDGGGGYRELRRKDLVVCIQKDGLRSRRRGGGQQARQGERTRNTGY